jgi:hypothetical protein
MVIAFHNDLQESKGTKNMVMLARNAHVPVKRVTDALQWDEINIAEL